MDVGGHCGDMAVRSVVVGVAGGGWDGENHHAQKERVDVCEAHDAGYVHRLKTAKEEDRVGGADEYVTKTPALDKCRIVSSGVASQYLYHGCGIWSLLSSKQGSDSHWATPASFTNVCAQQHFSAI